MPDRDRIERGKGWVKVLPWYWIRLGKGSGSRHDAKRRAIERDRRNG